MTTHAPTEAHDTETLDNVLTVTGSATRAPIAATRRSLTIARRRIASLTN